MQFAHANLSPAVASACARASVGVSSQEEMLGVALEAAVDDGDENVVQQLMLSALKEDRRSLKAHGELIFTCVEKGFAQAVTLFLASGVPGNLCLPSSCITPLHVACRHGAGEASRIIGLLLAGGAEVDARARDGATPLLEASSNGKPLVVRLLLEGRADANGMARDGGTPLSAAARNGHAGCVVLLQRFGAVDAPFAEAAPNGPTRVCALDAAEALASDSPQHAACVEVLRRQRASMVDGLKRELARATEVQAARAYAQKASEADAAAAALIAEEEEQAAATKARTTDKKARGASSSAHGSGSSRNSRRGQKAKAKASKAVSSTNAADAHAADADGIGASAAGMAAIDIADAEGSAAVTEPPATEPPCEPPQPHVEVPPTPSTPVALTEPSLSGGGGDSSLESLHAAFECPITQELMRDPVVTADGQTYEREAIERWISNQQGKGQAPTSPLTGAPLEHTNLVPNVLLRGLMREVFKTDS